MTQDDKHALPLWITAIATATIATISVGWTIYAIDHIEKQANTLTQAGKEQKYMLCLAKKGSSLEGLEDCIDTYLR